MSSAIVPSHRSRRRQHSDGRAQAARRDAFHRWLRYEPLEDRCLLSAGGSDVGSIGDKIVNISAPDPTAGEPLDTGTFRITRSGSTTNALTVNFCMTGDAALSPTGIGGDYYLEEGTTLLSGNTVTIDAGQVYVDITLVPYDDGQRKPDKTATMILETGSGYEVGTAYEANITLHNEITTTLPSIAVEATQPTASDVPLVDGVYRISRPSDADTTSALTVNFQMSGTAVQGTDYTLSYTDGTGTHPITSPDSVTIAAGNDYVDVDLTVIPSTLVVAPETATLTLMSGSDYAIDTDNSSASITVTHSHNGTAVTVAATVATAGFPSDTGTFLITRASSDLTSQVAVNFQMSGTAVQGTDYTLSYTDNTGTHTITSPDSVPIAAQSTYVVVTLTVIKDATTTETALMTLESGGCKAASGVPTWLKQTSIGESGVFRLRWQFVAG
ncbi:MAG: hypothetical protein WCB27_19875 [Thermoguttaceae bacterium]